ncbi:hypothetical protein C8J56DRAFT_743222, partial [Mycena floridula]
EQQSDNGVIARRLARVVYETTGYRFITWLNMTRRYRNTEKRTSGNASTYVFFCAQLKGQETKQRLVDDPQKRRSRLMMERFDCNGWLRITMTDNDSTTARVDFSHHDAHDCYVNISLGATEKAMVSDMKNLPPSKIWDELLRKSPDTELTERQIHREW